jgi:hypothetical protein
MSYREPPHLIELVASLCALPLIAAYRLEGGGVTAPETLAWFALTWALLNAARTCGRSGANRVAPQQAICRDDHPGEATKR